MQRVTPSSWQFIIIVIHMNTLALHSHKINFY